MTIDQVVIGSCTNGRISDMRAAAEILKGHKVHDGVRCIVLLQAAGDHREMIEEGIYQDMLAISNLRHLYPPPAGPAWAVTWDACVRGRSVSPRPTAISWAVWDMWIPR